MIGHLPALDTSASSEQNKLVPVGEFLQTVMASSRASYWTKSSISPLFDLLFVFIMEGSSMAKNLFHACLTLDGRQTSPYMSTAI